MQRQRAVDGRPQAGQLQRLQRGRRRVRCAAGQRRKRGVGSRQPQRLQRSQVLL